MKLIRKSDGKEAPLLTVDYEIRRMFGAPHDSDRFYADWIDMIRYYPAVSLDSEIKRMTIATEYAMTRHERNYQLLRLQIARWLQKEFTVR